MRFPESTAATTWFLLVLVWVLLGGSGSELPMQVVQPKPTRWNFMASRGLTKSAASRYSMTTFEPGASDVLTHGFTERPFSMAFFATRPAAMRTEGLEVCVQDVMAASVTAPWPSLKSLTATSVPAGAGVLPFLSFSARKPGRSLASHCFFTLPSSMRSCGRLGPAKEGTTFARSNDRVSANDGSIFSSRNKPCVLQ